MSSSRPENDFYLHFGECNFLVCSAAELRHFVLHLCLPPILQIEVQLFQLPPGMMNDHIKIAVICSSNQNRSMEAHAVLSKKGFNVRSFGSGNQVKLPGPSQDKPNIYEFGTPYEVMYNDLLNKDKNLYTQNGILHMLDRNRRIKTCPERFQNCLDKFDVIFTCEERVYDQVVEELSSRTPIDYSTVHIINIDVQDNHEEATLGAFLIYRMAQSLANSQDLDNDIDELLQDFESTINRPLLHTIAFQ